MARLDWGPGPRAGALGHSRRICPLSPARGRATGWRRQRRNPCSKRVAASPPRTRIRGGHAATQNARHLAWTRPPRARAYVRACVVRGRGSWGGLARRIHSTRSCSAPACPGCSRRGRSACVSHSWCRQPPPEREGPVSSAGRGTVARTTQGLSEVPICRKEEGHGQGWPRGGRGGRPREERASGSWGCRGRPRVACQKMKNKCSHRPSACSRNAHSAVTEGRQGGTGGRRRWRCTEERGRERAKAKTRSPSLQDRGARQAVVQPPKQRARVSHAMDLVPSCGKSFLTTTKCPSQIWYKTMATGHTSPQPQTTPTHHNPALFLSLLTMTALKTLVCVCLAGARLASANIRFNEVWSKEQERAAGAQR